MQGEAVAALRGQVGWIALGTVFVFVGIAACGVTAVRGWRDARLLGWFGLLNFLYGARLLAKSPAAFELLPQSLWASQAIAVAVISYVIMIPALLFWLELSRGKLRRFLQTASVGSGIIALAGMGAMVFSGSPYRFLPANNALVIVVLLVLALVVSVPSLGDRFGVVRSRVSAAGTLGLCVAALYENFHFFLNLPEYGFLEPIAFAGFVFSMGYVAAEKMFGDERRLLIIEKELVIAREIQNSILPAKVPQMNGLAISAAYRPMTAVAGDFYEFLRVDEHRAGILIADVSGHGVPAALIASMIKVAMVSVAQYADQPGEVLRGLNRILSGQLRGQLISAAYVWFDMEAGAAVYSAAGHPPLLVWRQGVMEKIESNGLLIGVLREVTYPVLELPLAAPARFLLYTDGVVEAENALGEAFGERRLEEVVRRSEGRSAGELSTELLAEVDRWQPAGRKQQDDITLIIVDVN